MSLEDLKKKNICNNPFNEIDFTNNSQNRLKKDAVPMSWKSQLASPPLKVKTPIKFYTKKQTLFSF